MKLIQEWTGCPEVKKDMGKKALIGLVLSLIVVVLLGVALVGPWYTMKTKIETPAVAEYGIPAETTEGKAENGLYSYTVSNNKTETKTYAEALDDAKEAGTEKTIDDTISVYNTAFYIMIGALVLGIISLILLIIAGIGKAKLIKMGTIFLLITMILAIVAPVYFAVALPSAEAKDWEDAGGTGEKPKHVTDFMGSDTEKTEIMPGYEMSLEMSWGPGYGWYLAVVAFVLALIGLIFTFIPGKKAALAPVAPAP